MERWEVQNKRKTKSEKLKTEELIDLLLENRGIKTKKEREEFLHPKLENVTSGSVGINKLQLQKALKRIKKAVEKKEQIVIFGDYDVDGICGSAILWETLFAMGATVVPYIPHRIDEGYGLSKTGISNVQFQISNISLIITVDNGIVANDAVAFANKQGIDVIVTDHHVIGKTLPKAHATIHTTKLCGTGVAYLLAREIKYVILEGAKRPIGSQKDAIASFQHDNRYNDHLALVALATVADLVPLTGANRTLVKFGLEKLKTTKRVGLLELFKEAAIDQKTISTYAIGHIIAPRLNAMGRLEYAMESLRLLCTNNQKRAEDLAFKLGTTNRERQQLTLESATHAIMQVKTQNSKLKNLVFIGHESYQAGVIGLIAGRLVEEFYRPAIVISIGKTHSKASARSIAGFNIIEFIRTASEHLVDAGGHPMAAGFTVETTKLQILQETLERNILELLDESLLTRSLRIDCELPLLCIDTSLHKAIQQLSPFGMGNPEPTFVSREVLVENIRLIGKDGRHLKLKIKNQKSNRKNEEEKVFDAVAFGMGDRIKELQEGKTVDIAYAIDENTWRGKTSLQLKIKDIKS